MTIVAIFFVILLACYAYSICRAVYYLFDHSGWEEHTKPNAKAGILKVSSEKVQYVKNGQKYKTTVWFSDGFYFITHKTNREDNFLSYEISVDEDLMEEIITKACKRHDKAVNQYFKNYKAEDK